MAQMFGTLPFLKQLTSHVSATTLQLKFPGMKFFLIHHGHWNIFWKVLKFFCVVLMKDKSSHIKKRKAWCVSLMYCLNFFRNQLWRHLISYNSFRNTNMCFLEVAKCEKCRSSHFQSEGGVKKLRTGVAGGKEF